MATQRFISTSFWDDRWIRSLDPAERYVYLYLITNPLTNIAGVYQITMDRIAFDTGYDARTLQPMLQRFADAQKAVFYHDEWMILPRWPKHQRWEKSKRIAEGIERIVRELPPDVLETMASCGYSYPIDRVSIPHAYPSSYLDTDTDTDTDTDRDTDSAEPRVEDSPTESEDPKPTEQTIELEAPVTIPAKRLEKLDAEYGKAVVRHYAEKVSDYCQTHDKRYKDYAAAIRQYIRRDEERGEFERIASHVRAQARRAPVERCEYCGRPLTDGEPCLCRREVDDDEDFDPRVVYYNAIRGVREGVDS